MADHVDGFTLIKWRYKDLSKKEMSAVEAHIAACPTCRARSDAVADAMIAKEADPQTGLAGIHERYAAMRDQTRRARLRSFWLPLGVGAAVVGLSTVAGSVLDDEAPVEPRLLVTSTVETPPQGAEGDLACTAFVKRSGVTAPISNGDLLNPSDRLGFFLYTESPGFVSVFATAENRPLVPLIPEKAPADQPLPMALDGAGRHRLPLSPPVASFAAEFRVTVFFSPHRFDRRILFERLQTSALIENIDALQQERDRLQGAFRHFRFRRKFTPH